MDPVNAPGITLAVVSPAVGATTVRVEETEASRFAAMVVPAEAVAVPLPAVAAQGADGVPRVSAPGDAILDGMRSIGAEFNAGWESLKVAVDQSAKSMTVSDMLRVQMQLIQLSVQVELVGKSIARTTQNIDQLVKLQ
jgi:type III secretion protein I